MSSCIPLFPSIAGGGTSNIKTSGKWFARIPSIFLLRTARAQFSTRSRIAASFLVLSSVLIWNSSASTLLNRVSQTDLSKVDEIGFVDLTPGSGHGLGGFSDVGWIEVYGKPIKR